MGNKEAFKKALKHEEFFYRFREIMLTEKFPPSKTGSAPTKLSMSELRQHINIFTSDDKQITFSHGPYADLQVLLRAWHHATGEKNVMIQCLQGWARHIEDLQVEAGKWVAAAQSKNNLDHAAYLQLGQNKKFDDCLRRFLVEEMYDDDFTVLQ